MGIPVTGWFFTTVNYNFFLTDLKSPQTHITQCFLRSLLINILIFWCFTSVRWNKSFIAALFKHRVIAQPYKDWTLKIQPKTHLNPTDIHRHHTDNLRHPLQAPCRHLQTTQDANRHIITPSDSQTPPDTPKCCLRVFESACWPLLASVGVCWHFLPPILSSGVWLMSGEVSEVIWVMSIHVCGVCIRQGVHMSVEPL